MKAGVDCVIVDVILSVQRLAQVVDVARERQLGRQQRLSRNVVLVPVAAIENRRVQGPGNVVEHTRRRMWESSRQYRVPEIVVAGQEWVAEQQPLVQVVPEHDLHIVREFALRD